MPQKRELNIKKFWYLVYINSWTKKVLTHSELKITWAGDISIVK